MSAPAASAPASIGRRVGAYVIDGIIAGLIAAVPAIVFGVAVAVNATRVDRAALALLVIAAYAIVLIVSLGWVVVYTLMQGGAGSVGQRVLGIRLVDAGIGTPIGFWRALLRNVVWYLGASIVVGMFSPLFDRSGRRQGWHDLVGRALVVGASRAPLPVAPPSSTPGLAPAAAPAPMPPAAAPPAPALVDEPLGDTTVVAFATSATTAPSLTLPAAPARPAPPVATTGIISSVPGFASGAAPAPPAAPAAPAPTPTPAPAPDPALAATPAAPTPALDEVDETRAAPSPRAVLTWDDGTRVAVYGATVFGRNPAAEDGVTVVAVRDETLSLSKTHFAVTPDAAGVWITDRHSTNGTSLVRSGERTSLPGGERRELRAGDRLEFGDRRATVGSVS